MEFVEDDKRTPESESFIKTECAVEKVGSETPTIEICEKEYGRLKLEKEQRKREVEEERRIEQLQAQERSRGNKKYKKKKKKSKENDSQNICDSVTDVHPNDKQQIFKPASSGKPLMELSTSNNKTEGVGRGADEKNNLVTSKKPMDRTICMKVKEGESDLTIMNGQAFTTKPGMINHPNSSATEMHRFWSPASPVIFEDAKTVYETYLRAQDEEFIIPRPQQRGMYPQIAKRKFPSHGMAFDAFPTSMDGGVRSEAPVPLQFTFVKPERPTPVVSVPAPTYQIPGTPPNPINHVSYQGLAVNSQYSIKDNGSMAEINLSQLKLPPGLTKRKFPKDIGAPRRKFVNGVHQPEYHQRPIVHGTMMPNVPANIIPNAQDRMPVSMTPTMRDYRRCASVGIVENMDNSNVMIYDSRCCSLESPLIGLSSHEMAFGAIGTRPSYEASFISDRPSSGLDSLCNYNGFSPYVSPVTGYPSTDILNNGVSLAMSSPFNALSRNETPSPAWQNDAHQIFTAMPGMINYPNCSATEMHGFWSSTPASPVAFANANADYKSYFESYLRAQDEEFIKLRPQQIGMYPQMPKGPSPSHGMAVDVYPTRMDVNPYQIQGAPPNPIKHDSYQGPAVNSQCSIKDNGSMAEIDLSQLKLPPGLTKAKVPQDIGAFMSVPGMINHPNSSATEIHGFWSSTPATPVASVIANPTYEDYVRAQEEEFMMHSQRGLYPQMAKRTSPSHGMAVDGVFTRKPPVSDFNPNITSNTSPQYNQGCIQFNGPNTRNIGPVGYKPLGDHCHHQPGDQWTPWNSQRLIPDGNAAVAHTEVPLFTSGIFTIEDSEPWDSWGSARTVNPFGPIGSNLNHRPSNATSNGIHGKLAETEITDEASL